MRSTLYSCLLLLATLSGQPSGAAEAGPSGPSALPARASIAWQGDWDAALALAKAENRPVMLAVNMDGERANDTLAEDTYEDKMIRALAEGVVALPASGFDHGSGTCSRFGEVSCAEHQAIDKKARAEVLPAGPDGAVIAPQHVFLDGDGKVLMSVAYGITADELAWCLVTARLKVDPDADVRMPADARAPRRLVMERVAAVDEETVRPLTEEELEEVLTSLRSGSLRGMDLVDEIIKLLATDHPDAIDAMRAQLLQSQRAAAGRREGAAERVAEQRRLMVRRIGELSPVSYWEAVAALLTDNDLGLRAEAAVALEQLAAPEAAKELRTRLSKEKDAEALIAIVRALGTCGADDSGARKKLLGVADEDDARLRRNALYALGQMAGDKSVAKRLGEALQAGDPGDRRAAALGLAFARDTSMREGLAQAREEAADGTPLRGTLDRVLSVLDGGDLEIIREEILAVCGDTIPRRRWFLKDAQ